MRRSPIIRTTQIYLALLVPVFVGSVPATFLGAPQAIGLIVAVPVVVAWGFYMAWLMNRRSLWGYLGWAVYLAFVAAQAWVPGRATTVDTTGIAPDGSLIHTPFYDSGSAFFRGVTYLHVALLALVALEMTYIATTKVKAWRRSERASVGHQAPFARVNSES